MAASKKLTLNSAGTDVTIADATFTDILTTAISTTETVTGLYGFAQKAGLIVAGMAIQSKRMGGSLNPFA